MENLVLRLLQPLARCTDDALGRLGLEIAATAEEVDEPVVCAAEAGPAILSAASPVSGPMPAMVPAGPGPDINADGRQPIPASVAAGLPGHPPSRALPPSTSTVADADASPAPALPGSIPTQAAVASVLPGNLAKPLAEPAYGQPVAGVGRQLDPAAPALATLPAPEQSKAPLRSRPAPAPLRSWVTPLAPQTMISPSAAIGQSATASAAADSPAARDLAQAVMVPPLLPVIVVERPAPQSGALAQADSPSAYRSDLPALPDAPVAADPAQGPAPFAAATVAPAFAGPQGRRSGDVTGAASALVDAAAGRALAHGQALEPASSTAARPEPAPALPLAVIPVQGAASPVQAVPAEASQPAASVSAAIEPPRFAADAVLPRGLRVVAKRIDRLLEPVMDRAYALSASAASVALGDGDPASAGRDAGQAGGAGAATSALAPDDFADPPQAAPGHQVNNTFNVNVAMAGGGTADREKLEQVLSDVLRTSARRHGLLP